MFNYTTCGLTISSYLELPELLKSDFTQADVTISLGRLEHRSEVASTTLSLLDADQREVRLYWKNVGIFVVREGSEIVVEPDSSASDQVVRLFLLGRVLATVLHQRGLLVLHASAVATETGAIAFLGGKGWGKSTLAGALYETGHAIIADDVVAVELDHSQRPRVYPSFPQIKLWPEAAATLGIDVNGLARLHPEFEKLARPVLREFSSTPMPLARLYVLDEGDSTEISEVSPRDAFVQVIRHSYAANLLQATGTIRTHFNQVEKLVNTVPVHRLRRAHSLCGVTDLARFVERDAALAVEGKYRRANAY